MKHNSAKAFVLSPLGRLTLTATDFALTGLYMEGQCHFDPDSLANLPLDPEHPILRQASLWLEDYFSCNQPHLTAIPLAPVGTPFQMRVWELLKQIPYGQTVTYGELAVRLGLSVSSARSIGSAVGRNPISIIIPCHRVLGADGKLTGFAGGVERKLWLLRHEGTEI